MLDGLLHNGEGHAIERHGPEADIAARMRTIHPRIRVPPTASRFCSMEDLVQYRIIVRGEEGEEREIITDPGDQMSLTVSKLRHAWQFSVSVSAFVPQFGIRDDLQGSDNYFSF